MANIGKTIRTMRLSRGMSQAELAVRIGKKRSAVGNYENGTREPDLDTIEALADAFNVSMTDLLGHETNEEEELWDYREQLRRDPERRILFSMARNANIEDVRRAVAVIDALKKASNPGADSDEPV